MAYDLYLVAAPQGADVEETGEALLGRLGAGLRREPGEAELARIRAVEESLVLGTTPLHAEAGPVPGSRSLTASDGTTVLLDGEFVRFRVPFEHLGEEAEALFRRLFERLGRVVEVTGWRIYDPQDARPVAVTDDDRERILEIYLSVMDQL